jgi:phosphatidylserine decarboxylase
MTALTYATAQLLRVLPRRGLSRLVGGLAERRWPTPVVSSVVFLYRRAYAVDLDECEPQEDYPSFDAFFTRRLRNGARPMPADADVLVSPADGRLDCAQTIEADSTFAVKGTSYSVAELVGDDEAARNFVGGRGWVVYLSPRDYHRVHAPVSGRIRRIRSIPGDYLPVNAIGLAHFDGLFVRNRRVAIDIESVSGTVCVVMVAAMIVGRISVAGIPARDVPLGTHTLAPPLEVARGDEIGIFHLGSTAVVLAPKEVVDTSFAELGNIRMGAPLGRRGAG